MRARLIYNPSAGKEEIKRNLAEILDLLETNEIETTTHMTRGREDTIKAVEKTVEHGYDLLIAAGGDGTLNEVINGLAKLERRPPLAIIPAGTTNDFARAIGIPRDFHEACKIIVEQKKIKIDVGYYNSNYFLNIAGGGSLTNLTFEVSSKMKTALGQLAYYVRGIEKLPFIKPIHVTLESEIGLFTEDIMLFLVANSNSVGGFRNLVPTAELNDGKFDVLIVKSMPISDFIRLAGSVLIGEHISDPRVMIFKTSWLKVHSAEHAQVNLDGELGGVLPGEFRIIPKQIEIIVPQQFN